MIYITFFSAGEVSLIGLYIDLTMILISNVVFVIAERGNSELETE